MDFRRQQMNHRSGRELHWMHCTEVVIDELAVRWHAILRRRAYEKRVGGTKEVHA